MNWGSSDYVLPLLRTFTDKRYTLKPAFKTFEHLILVWQAPIHPSKPISNALCPGKLPPGSPLGFPKPWLFCWPNPDRLGYLYLALPQPLEWGLVRPSSEAESVHDQVYLYHRSTCRCHMGARVRTSVCVSLCARPQDG